MAKAQELLKSEDISFDKKEKLEAAIDDLDIAVKYDTDDEFEVGKKARALRTVMRAILGKQDTDKTKKASKRTISKAKRLVSRYEKAIKKEDSSIPSDVQIKMAKLKSALREGKEKELKAATASYIDSVKLAKAWRGVKSEPVITKAPKEKGPDIGKIAYIGSLASRIVSPKEVSTSFPPVNVYTNTIDSEKDKLPEIVMGKVTVHTPTIEDEFDALPEKIQELLDRTASKLSTKLGDKAYGKITVQIEVATNGKPSVSVTNVQKAGGTARDLVAAFIATHIERNLRLVPRKEKSIIEFDVELK